MHDFTEGYDSSKPLLIERPLDYMHYTSLIFNKDENVTDYFLFFREGRVEEKDYQLVFEIDMRENKLIELDVVPSTFPGLIVNKKVVEILKRVCPNDFQVFPVIIKSKPEKRESKKFVNYDYFLIHIINKVESIDLEKSEFLLFDDDKPKERGNILSPVKLRFKSNCLNGINIAKDSILKSVEFVSQSLFRVLFESDIKGVEFVPDYLCHYERSNYPELFRGRESH